jgi:hypothetical protein
LTLGTTSSLLPAEPQAAEPPAEPLTLSTTSMNITGLSIASSVQQAAAPPPPARVTGSPTQSKVPAAVPLFSPPAAAATTARPQGAAPYTRAFPPAFPPESVQHYDA